MIGPVTLTATFHIRVGDALHRVEVRCPPGQPITERDIVRLLGRSLANVRREIDASAELPDAWTFFNQVLVAEHCGQPGAFDLPESFDYDHHALQVEALAAHCMASMPPVERVQ